MSDGLFEVEKEVQTPATPSASPASIDTLFADQLKQIVNERGEPKYDSLPKAIDALKHSQEYIPQLRTELSQKDAELQQLREELAKRQTAEEIISKFTPPQPEPVQHQSAPQGLDESTLEALVQRQLAKQAEVSTQTANTTSVQNALIQKFGDKAKEVVAQKAQELGLSLQALGELSAKSPAAVLALFQASPSAPTGAPMRSSVHLPDVKQEVDLTPHKSMLRGSSEKDQVEYMRKIKAAVYAKHDITN